MPDSSVRDSSSRKRHPPSLNEWRSAQDFRRKGDGAKYNKALPEEASPDAFGHHPIISGLLEEHLSDPRTSSLSEVSSLPHVPPDLEAFPYDLSLSHRWTYPSVRRLLRLAHATANRPNDTPYFRDVPVSQKERELLFEWRPLLKVHDGFRAFTQHLVHHSFRTEEEKNILSSRRLLRRAFGLDPKPQTGQFPQDARLCLIKRLCGRLAQSTGLTRPFCYASTPL
ncbi:hypothetical protein GGP86_002735 [Salinibacter ruber]|nr:hypothetical protein [Salinibacter ruber]